MTLNRQHNPQLIRNALFARCKAYWGAGLVFKFLIFTFAIIVVLVAISGKLITLVGIGLVILSEFFLWKSDRWKSAAHGLHRKLDFEDSLGWRVSNSELTDYLARYPGRLEKLAGETTGSYFASQQPTGTKRAVENLTESSWWSLHLAESMWWIFISSIVVILLGCIVLLNISIGDLSTATDLNLTPQSQINTVATPRTLPPQGVRAEVVKVVTSAILFVFTYGLFRFATGYYSFSVKSKQIKERAEQLLQSSSPDQIQVVKLWQDYHLAREASPIIPTWIWKLREKKLNALFNSYMKGQGIIQK